MLTFPAYDQHSISGCAKFLAGGPISWQSRLYLTVTLSTMGAEYMTATASQGAFSLKFLWETMGLNVANPIVLKEDIKKACPDNHRVPNTLTIVIIL